MFLEVRVYSNVEHIKEMGKEIRLRDRWSLAVLLVNRTLLEDDTSNEFGHILCETERKELPPRAFPRHDTPVEYCEKNGFEYKKRRHRHNGQETTH